MFYRVALAIVIAGVATISYFDNAPGTVVSKAEAEKLFGGKKGCAKMLSGEERIYCRGTDGSGCDGTTNYSPYYQDPSGSSHVYTECLENSNCLKPTSEACG
jgi:hypothetical protein